MKKLSLYICVFTILIINISCASQKKNEVNIETIEAVEEPVSVKKLTRIQDPVLNAIVLTAWENYHIGRYEQAALDFERLYKKGYDHYDILFGAGICYFKYYDLKKSIQYLDLALLKKPDHFTALYIRGLYYNNLKKYTEAKKNFSAVLSVETHENFTCGYYKKDFADKKDLKKLQEEIKNNLIN